MNVAKMRAETAKKAAVARISRELEAHFEPIAKAAMPVSFFNLLCRLEDAQRLARIKARYGVAH
jgi:hypothetical protein